MGNWLRALITQTIDGVTIVTVQAHHYSVRTEMTSHFLFFELRKENSVSIFP